MMRDAIITFISRVIGGLARRTVVTIPDDPRRILIVKSCCLGDVLFTTPLLHALRERFPRAHITYAVGAWSRPMVATSADVDAVLTIPDRWTLGSLLAVARAWRGRFDMVFVPERTPLPGIVTWLAGIPVRIGLDSQGRGFAYTHPVAVPSTLIHEAELYLMLAQAVGIASADQQLRFFPTAQDREEAQEIAFALPAQRPIIVIHPGGGSNPGMTLATKRWLPERWAIVVDELHRTRDAQVVLVGSADERTVVQEVRDAMQTPATMLAQQWRWGTLAALIERATLFLGHDTGMTHLAHAVGTPVVAVYGPSDPQTYGPRGPRSRVVWRPTPESPCFYDGVAPLVCPCAGRCMRNVEVRDVLRAIDRVLDHDSPSTD
jgi:lipopolysaccharide heptosyltransferase II